MVDSASSDFMHMIDTSGVHTSWEQLLQILSQSDFVGGCTIKWILYIEAGFRIFISTQEDAFYVASPSDALLSS